MDNVPSCLYWLGGSLVVAVLIDAAIARLCLEFLRPTYSQGFWAGRVGKVTALSFWMIFVAQFWLPNFVPAMDPHQAMIKAGMAAVVGVTLLFAVASTPHSGLNKEESRG